MEIEVSTILALMTRPASAALLDNKEFADIVINYDNVIAIMLNMSRSQTTCEKMRNTFRKKLKIPRKIQFLAKVGKKK